jgi:hypothetical protein
MTEDLNGETVVGRVRFRQLDSSISHFTNDWLSDFDKPSGAKALLYLGP